MLFHTWCRHYPCRQSHFLHHRLMPVLRWKAMFPNFRSVLDYPFDHVTSQEVRAKIQQAIGPHENLLTSVKRPQTAVVWSCLPFIRSGQNHLARHSDGGKKTRQTEEEVGRQHQGMDRPGVCRVPKGSGEQGKMEETGCAIICGGLTTLAVKR